MYFSHGSFYDRCHLSFSTMRCLIHILSLCLSAILLSSPPLLFDIKCCLTILCASFNKSILLRTVLISKVTSIRNAVKALDDKLVRLIPQTFFLSFIEAHHSGARLQPSREYLLKWNNGSVQLTSFSIRKIFFLFYKTSLMRRSIVLSLPCR